MPRRNDMRRMLLLLLNLGSALGRLVEGPINSAVIAGQWMSMTCKTDGKSQIRKWDHYDTSRKTSTVYSNSSRQVSGHFGVQVTDMGSGFLYTNVTEMSDSGIYTCWAVIEGNDRDFNAILVVLESDPFCETNWTADINQSLTEGGTIWIRYSVNFSGFWAPKMRWRQHWTDGQKLMDIQGVPKCSDTSCSSDLVVTLKSTDEGSFFSCYVYFGQFDNRERVVATNVPSYNYTWTSKVIRLKRTTVSKTGDEKSSKELYFLGFSGLFIVLIFVTVVCGVRSRRKLLEKQSRNQTRGSSFEPSIEQAAGDVSSFENLTYAGPKTAGTIAGADDGRQYLDSNGMQNPMKSNVLPLSVAGADGTVYMDLNGMQDLTKSRARPLLHQPVMFSRSEYADIDHVISQIRI